MQSSSSHEGSKHPLTRPRGRPRYTCVAKPFSLSSKVSCPHESPTHGTKEKLWQLGSLKTIPPPPPPSPLQFLPPLFRSREDYAIWQTRMLLRLNICLMAWSRISLSLSPSPRTVKEGKYQFQLIFGRSRIRLIFPAPTRILQELYFLFLGG